MQDNHMSPIDISIEVDSILPIGKLVKAVIETSKKQPVNFPDKIVIVDCGGTICCVDHKDGKGLVPTPGYIENYVEKGPGTYNSTKPVDPNNFNIFKDIKHKIDFSSVYDDNGQPLDSSQMRPDVWNKMISTISGLINSGKYRGIVVTHGTDTLAFTASALTFAFPFLPIPIILTAAQYSLEESYTDAVNNLYGSCMVALGGGVGGDNAEGTSRFYPEALVFFNNTLFLGTRIRKANASEMNATFESSIGRLGVWTDGIHLDSTQQERVLVSRVTHLIYWLLKKDLTAPYGLSDTDCPSACLQCEYEVRRSIENHLAAYCYLHRLPLYRGFADALNFLTQLMTEFFRPGVFFPQIGLPMVNNPDTVGHQICALKLFPYTAQLLPHFLDKAFEQGIRLFVLEAFGAGNGPDEVGEWFYYRNLHCTSTGKEEDKVYLAIVTQCFDGGFVSAKYAAGLARSATQAKGTTTAEEGEEEGSSRYNNAAYVASCADMSFECAVAKLWNLGTAGFDVVAKERHQAGGDRKQMTVSLRGELSYDDSWY